MSMSSSNRLAEIAALEKQIKAIANRHAAIRNQNAEQRRRINLYIRNLEKAKAKGGKKANDMHLLLDTHGHTDKNPKTFTVPHNMTINLYTPRDSIMLVAYCHMNHAKYGSPGLHRVLKPVETCHAGKPCTDQYLYIPYNPTTSKYRSVDNSLRAKSFGHGEFSRAMLSLSRIDNTGNIIRPLSTNNLSTSNLDKAGMNKTISQFPVHSSQLKKGVTHLPNAGVIFVANNKQGHVIHATIPIVKYHTTLSVLSKLLRKTFKAHHIVLDVYACRSSENCRLSYDPCNGEVRWNRKPVTLEKIRSKITRTQLKQLEKHTKGPSPRNRKKSSTSNTSNNSSYFTNASSGNGRNNNSSSNKN